MDLKEIRQIWLDHGFRPAKGLGQNFLVDKNVIGKIIDVLSLNGNGTIVEIGPGFGAMSFPLASCCDRLIAIDKDKRVCDIMYPLFAARDNIVLVNADILDVDIRSIAGGDAKIMVYGNIPYYISTPIIQRMIDQRKDVGDVYLVMQEELADRIVSSSGSREYGAISCYVQYHAKAKKIFRIRRGSFYPKPKVDSCLLHLKLLEEPAVPVKDESLMFRIIRKAFSQRRKKMVNPLSKEGFLSLNRTDMEKCMEGCGIDISSRAEDLSVAQYAAFSDSVQDFLKRRDGD